MPSPKNNDTVAGADLVHKLARRKRELPPVSKAYLETALAPLAERLPSQTPPAAVRVDGPLPEPATVEEFFAVLSDEIVSAKKQYMRIGALLDRAEGVLGTEGRANLVRRLSAVHNVGASALSQMMRAYRAIASGRIPPEMEEAGYTTVYLLSDLSDAEAKQARAEGLLQRGVRQSTVKEFVRRLRQPRASTIAAKRATLEAEIADLEAKLAAARARLATLVD